MLFGSSLQSHESTKTSAWQGKFVLPRGSYFQWVFLVMRWKTRCLWMLVWEHGELTRSTPVLWGINLVGSSQIEPSNGSFQICSPRTICSFLKGSGIMKFYTHTHTHTAISSGWNSIGVFFWVERGPVIFPQKKVGAFFGFMSLFWPLISTDGYIYGQHHKNMDGTSSFPVNLLGWMPHFETHTAYPYQHQKLWVGSEQDTHRSLLEVF